MQCEQLVILGAINEIADQVRSRDATLLGEPGEALTRLAANPDRRRLGHDLSRY